MLIGETQRCHRIGRYRRKMDETWITGIGSSPFFLGRIRYSSERIVCMVESEIQERMRTSGIWIRMDESRWIWMTHPGSGSESLWNRLMTNIDPNEISSTVILIRVGSGSHRNSIRTLCSLNGIFAIRITISLMVMDEWIVYSIEWIVAAIDDSHTWIHCAYISCSGRYRILRPFATKDEPNGRI